MLKFRSKRTRQDKPWPRKWLVLTYMSMGLALVVASFLWSSSMNLSRVSRVRIFGARFLAESEYRNLLPNFDSESLSDVSLGDITDLLEAHPLVKAVRVSRTYPGQLTIQIKERQPLAMINLPKIKFIDAEGIVLPDYPSLYQLELPILSNFNPAIELYPDGYPVVSQQTHEAVNLLAGIGADYPLLFHNLSEIRLNTQDDFELVLAEKPTRIILGKGNLKDKLKILNEFALTLHQEKSLIDYSYLDLRYKYQVIARERHA